MGKIFISHSSANNAEALAIHDWLAEGGWGDVFLDLDPRRGLVAGDRWQAALKAAAESCELILILISPDWAKSKWCLAEFLLAKQMNKQILGVVVKPTPLEDLPVELTAEWQLVDLSAADTGWTTTISPPRFEPETKVHFSGTGLARLRSGLEKAGLDATTFNWPPADDPGRAPYRGLLPLEAEDAGIFFGRDGAIILTLDALRGLAAQAPPRFATILGASGAGKSSFLRAGLLPRLGRDGRRFQVLPIVRPGRAVLTGEHGFAAMLDAALKARNVTVNRADIRDAVTAGAAAVVPLLRRAVASTDSGDAAAPAEPPVLVLAVDQAEELLTADNAEAAAFLTLLAELGRSDDPKLLVIFTVRSDSFDQLQARPELAATQPHHLVDLPPVPAGSFGDIIRGPARRVSAASRKLVVEETLVDALLNDIETGGAKDALPLLAFTLERLFTDYGADGDLQLSEYEKLGRIRGAIEAAVERALGKADINPTIPRDRNARLALLRRGLIPWLAGIDPATGSPRRRVARLAEVPAEARPLIELMVDERLLSTDVDKATGERTIEPAHEALLRQWGALDGWLAEDTADLTLIEAVRRAATEWEASARGPEFLVHTGARLATAEQLANAEKFSAYLTSVDRAYLAACREAEQAALRRARAARTRLTIAGVAAGVILLVGGTAAFFLQRAADAARVESAANFAVAQSEAALREGRPEDAARAALDAYGLLPSGATRTSALTAAMSVSPNAIATFPASDRIADTAWSDPTHLVVLTARGQVTTLDVTTRKAAAGPSIQSSAPPIAMIPSEDGTHVVYADASIGGADGAAIAVPPDSDETAGFAPRAGTVHASADGKVVAMVGLAGDVLLRDCRSAPCADRMVTPPADAPPGLLAGAVAVSPDGRGLAVNWWPGFVVVYADTGAPRMIELPANAANFGVVTSMDWSSSGKLAIATDAGKLLIIEAITGSVTVSSDLGGSVTTLAWSPAAPILAVPCDGMTICLYRDTGELAAAFVGHTDKPASLHWSPDGKSLSSTAPGDPVRLWSIAPDRAIGFDRRTPTAVPLTTVGVNDDRSTVAAGDQMGSIWLWHGDDPIAHLSAPEGIQAPVSSLAYLSDGRIAAVYENKAIAVWSTGKTVPDSMTQYDNASFSRIARLTGSSVFAAVPFTDRRIVALAGVSFAATEIAADSYALTPWGIAGAPQPDKAFVSYSDGAIRLRDLKIGGDGVPLNDPAKSSCGETPTNDNNGARSLAVSPDGAWVVATRTDAHVIVYDAEMRKPPICLALPAPDSKTVAFAPGSKLLAILSATDHLYVFDITAPDSAIILGAPAVADNSPAAIAAGHVRTTSWLDWLDDDTLVISTAGGSLETVSLDPAAWRARVDSLFFAQ